MLDDSPSYTYFPSDKSMLTYTTYFVNIFIKLFFIIMEGIIGIGQLRRTITGTNRIAYAAESKLEVIRV